LFTLNDGRPELKSQFRIREGSGQHFSFPVIAGGVMYIRRGDTLMAFAVSLKHRFQGLDQGALCNPGNFYTGYFDKNPLI
jgi:hypothetical protein